MRYWLLIRCVLDGMNSKVAILDKILYEGADAENRANQAAKIICEKSKFLIATVIPG